MKYEKVAVCMFFAALLPVGAVGCGHARSPAEAEAGLNDPDPEVRRHSADSLRSRDGVPAEALPKLYAAIDKEQDQEAYGAELITLGASGDGKALAYICKNVGGGADGDVRMSRWANHALLAWEKKNPGTNGCKGASTATPAAPSSATPSTGATRSL